MTASVQFVLTRIFNCDDIATRQTTGAVNTITNWWYYCKGSIMWITKY